MRPTFFRSAAAFRGWLARHHGSEKELLVGFHKVATGRRSMTYKEAVDEALSFGWIDGVRRGLDDASYTIRFTPRKPTSIWSAVNIERARRRSTGDLCAEREGIGVLSAAGAVVPPNHRALGIERQATGNASAPPDDVDRLLGAE
jgi:hypothetical protein